MARIRTIKPEFWTHEDLSELPEPTHMLAAALLNHADDEGYFHAHPGLVKAACSPLREPSVSIQDSLILLQKCGYIRVGKAPDGKRYGHVLKFDEHQRVNRPTDSKIKKLSIVWEDSRTTHGRLSEDSLQEGNREQGTGNGKDDASDDAYGDQGSNGKSASKANKLIAAVVAAYHEALPNCARVAVINPKRARRIREADKLARKIAEEQGWGYDVDNFWSCYFSECAQDPWMRGDVANPNNPSWKQNLHVLIEENRFAEVMDRAVTSMQVVE